MSPILQVVGLFTVSGVILLVAGVTDAGWLMLMIALIAFFNSDQ